VVEAVQAQAKTVKTAKLISELASTASQMRDKPEPPAPQADAQADTTERGWRMRVASMVREVLRRLDEREAAAKLAAVKLAKQVGAHAQAIKTAQRDKADERALAKPARRAEIKTFVPAANRNTPKSTDREVDRSALLIAGRDDPIEEANRNFNGFGKIDMSKSEPMVPEIARPELVALGDGGTDEAKPQNVKADGKHGAQRRGAAPRVVKYLYSDDLTRPF
jgi:hypothetical protein